MFERCLFFNANSLARTLNRIWEQTYHSFDLTPSQAYLLRAVLTQYGMNHQHLSRALNLEKSTTSRLVDQLESKDLVVREHESELDARLIKITPTQKAEGIHADLEMAENKLYHHLSSLIGHETLKSVVSEIRQIQIALSMEKDTR